MEYIYKLSFYRQPNIVVRGIINVPTKQKAIIRIKNEKIPYYERMYKKNMILRSVVLAKDNY